jgi:hypothetical protein
MRSSNAKIKDEDNKNDNDFDLMGDDPSPSQSQRVHELVSSFLLLANHSTSASSSTARPSSSRYTIEDKHNHTNIAIAHGNDEGDEDTKEMSASLLSFLLPGTLNGN